MIVGLHEECICYIWLQLLAYEMTWACVASSGRLLWWKWMMCCCGLFINHPRPGCTIASITGVRPSKRHRGWRSRTGIQYSWLARQHWRTCGCAGGPLCICSTGANTRGGAAAFQPKVHMAHNGAHAARAGTFGAVHLSIERAVHRFFAAFVPRHDANTAILLPASAWRVTLV